MEDKKKEDLAFQLRMFGAVQEVSEEKRKRGKEEDWRFNVHALEMKVSEKVPLVWKHLKRHCSRNF